jgi:hypothetical protein
MLAVFYAKIVDDKQDGVYLADVYFGGIGKDNKEAEKIARECVNVVRGGTIIPKIITLNGSFQLLSAMKEATEKFQAMEREMFLAEDIIAHNNKKR